MPGYPVTLDMIMGRYKQKLKHILEGFPFLGAMTLLSPLCFPRVTFYSQSLRGHFIRVKLCGACQLQITVMITNTRAWLIDQTAVHG